MNRRLICALVMSTLEIVSAVEAGAELKFKRTEIELHPSISDRTAVAHFEYQNVGKEPVQILSVRTSCGCTVAANNKDEVAPGEKGEVTATFDIGERVGLQTKTINVQTDDPLQPVTILTLDVRVPQLLQIAPAFLYWKKGEAPTPKTIHVKAGDEFPVTTLKVRSSGLDFVTTVEPGATAKEFVISVEPKQTDHPSAATMIVQPDFQKDRPRKYYISARVLNANRNVSLPPGVAPALNVVPASPIGAPPAAPSPVPSASPR